MIGGSVIEDYRGERDHRHQIFEASLSNWLQLNTSQHQIVPIEDSTNQLLTKVSLYLETREMECETS